MTSHHKLGSMSSPKGKSPLVSHSIAPPPDAPSLDVQKLDKKVRQLDIGKTKPGKVPASKALDSSGRTVKPEPPHVTSLKKTQPTDAGRTSRLKTEQYKIGNMDRTYIEAMVPASKYDRRYANHTSSSSQQTYSTTRTMAPPSARSIFGDKEDVVMAKRQTQYASLSAVEQERQDNWARSMITRTGSCPEGFAWTRIHDGYQCNGGFHVISDELLSEGRGGVYALQSRDEPHLRWGPYYAEPSHPTLFSYAGAQPKPRLAPYYLGDDAGLWSIIEARLRPGAHGSRLGAGRLGSPMGTGIPRYGASRFGTGSRNI